LTFNDGGSNEFYNKFTEMKSRLHHAAQIAAETGQTNILQHVHGEQLPQYSPRDDEAPSSAALPMPREADRQTNESTGQTHTNQQVPDEPPPDYDSAQAQAVSARFDERAREDASRE
jgi:WW domain-binding protein 2